MVFPSQRKSANVHLIVLARTTTLHSLQDCSEEHAELLGHMMVVAAKVAREQGIQGYRIVNNNGKNAH